MIEKTLGVYFIDQYNFPQLCDSASAGDSLAHELVKSLTHFIKKGPKPTCAKCHSQVLISDVPLMTIVILRSPEGTLTSWICENCAAQNNLDSWIEQTVREWSGAPENTIVVFDNKNTTLH